MSKPKETALDDLDFSDFVRAGDGVVWGQLSSEPIPLSQQLLSQRQSIGRFSVFLGATFSESANADYADVVNFRGIGGIGNNRKLERAGVLDIIPTQLSSIPIYFSGGQIRSDVALVQMTEEDDGGYGFAVGSDYIVAAVQQARIVIGEVNAQAPRTFGPHRIPREKIACLVRTDRPVLSVAAAKVGPLEEKIARFASEYIPDGAVLQVGIGAVPEAIMAQLNDRRNLGVHSGMIGDSVADLVEAGVITNALKPFNQGLTVTGMLAGTERLYRFANRNPALTMRSLDCTHDAGLLASIPRLISINSAVEVDLTGQVNAEEVGGRHLGAVGGAVDYVRGAHRAPGGRSIIAMPSTAGEGKISRVVARLAGPVSTSRSDVDLIVTEYGAADLRGRSLAQRAQAMIAIAHPDHQEALSRAVHEQFKGGQEIYGCN
ncbi:acetyl-CoA hydrolase/transferase [Pusillimonas sp. T7-7]|uniref:acetyl-CoA hydrolase/transferase family protein n=1 Tax=Pusillimonas sp. (strain T7-7) TaxID=1007105 RepID=UPI0002084F59|nr:acetyl-CoA hydrolase/transferase C-terminal domain-containing protein [Pusillimonas sp. T7-7]AEC21213.1 acetyl-CoA hydrolase/transferase [Pusillimonas sp. T7-7]